MKQILLLFALLVLLKESVSGSSLQKKENSNYDKMAIKMNPKRRINIEWGRLERRLNPKEHLENIKKTKLLIEQEKRNELYRRHLASRIKSSILRDFFSHRYK